MSRISRSSASCSFHSCSLSLLVSWTVQKFEWRKMSLESKIQNRPLVSQIQNQPPVSKIQNRPLVFKIQNRPLVSKIRHRPLFQIQNRPLVSKIWHRPLVFQIQNRPLVAKFKIGHQCPRSKIQFTKGKENFPRFKPGFHFFILWLKKISLTLSLSRSYQQFSLLSAIQFLWR